MDYLYVCAGLVALFFGGEALVRGSLALALRLGLSPFVIGLTVVGFGTSTPELLVSVDAALGGLPDIALGNVIGSNIANILLILGVTAIIWPFAVSGRTVRRDAAVLLGSAVLLVPFLAMGTIGRGAGGVLLCALVLYLVMAYKAGGDAEPETEIDADQPFPMAVWPSLLWVGAGLAALMVGAGLLVEGAASIARTMGLSEAFIGLTIVAVGTSLPELATSITAALRRQSDLAVANVVGSNIFNTLGILGATALTAPILAAPRFLAFDLPVMVALSALLTAVLWFKWRFSRPMGFFLLLVYGGYIWSSAG